LFPADIFLSGRTLKFVNKSIGFNRFDIEFSD